MRSLTRVLCALTAVVLVAATPSSADPWPHQVLKFQQLPLDGLPVGDEYEYFGHDELSTAWLAEQGTAGNIYQGYAMADDFADIRIDYLPEQPVVHVRWWGSYLNNEIVDPVDKFLIAFESDVPADVGGAPFSHPGEVLLTQTVRRVAAGPPPPGTFTEKAISPGGPPLGETLYEYNAELHPGKWFWQQPDTVYWLKIVALVDGPAPDPASGLNQTEWGWHNRDYTVPDPLASTPPAVVPGEHVAGKVALPDGTEREVWHFQDNAVSSHVFVQELPDMPSMPYVSQTDYVPEYYLDRIDGPAATGNYPGIGEFSKDLAFELYTVPEPVSLALFGVGASIALASTRRRERF